MRTRVVSSLLYSNLIFEAATPQEIKLLILNDVITFHKAPLRQSPGYIPAATWHGGQPGTASTWTTRILGRNYNHFQKC